MKFKDIEKSFNPRLAVNNYNIYLKNSKYKAKLAEKILTGKKILTTEALNYNH